MEQQTQGASDQQDVALICVRYDNDPHRMLDILRDVQDQLRWISRDTMGTVAKKTGLSEVAVEGVASFYAFLSLEPKGRVTIRLCDDIIDRFAGLRDVVTVFEQELGISVGETSADGAISLEYTPCIGMCDQAPAVMIDDVVLTALTPEKVRDIAVGLKEGKRPQDLIAEQFDDLSPYARVQRMVKNNIRHVGDVLLGPVPDDAGLKNAIDKTPAQIIDQIADSGLRGCGGAGFTTGMKWRFAANAEAERRFIICNADEGEPGTFKDRVLLTERPHLLIEGMTIFF